MNYTDFYRRIPKYFITIALVIPMSFTLAQDPGLVDYKNLGVRFEIPFGWIGQEVQDGYMIGSNTQPGYIMLTKHEFTHLDSLEKQIRADIEDGVSTALKFSGSMQKVKTGIGAEYEGTLQGQFVKAFIARLINAQGPGISIIAATPPNQYTTEYERLVVQIAESVKFYSASSSPAVTQWQRALKNSRLRYVTSYAGSSTNGHGSEPTDIHLCAAGFFRSKNLSPLFNLNGVTEKPADGKNGQGVWQVIETGSGAALVLKYHTGTYEEYKLEERSGQTLLNGMRYFRTYGDAGQEQGPRC